MVQLVQLVQVKLAAVVRLAVDSAVTVAVVAGDPDVAIFGIVTTQVKTVTAVRGEPADCGCGLSRPVRRPEGLQLRTARTGTLRR